jgi:hypothetical protein
MKAMEDEGTCLGMRETAPRGELTFRGAHIAKKRAFLIHRYARSVRAGP